MMTMRKDGTVKSNENNNEEFEEAKEEKRRKRSRERSPIISHCALYFHIY